MNDNNDRKDGKEELEYFITIKYLHYHEVVYCYLKVDEQSKPRGFLDAKIILYDAIMWIHATIHLSKHRECITAGVNPNINWNFSDNDVPGRFINYNNCAALVIKEALHEWGHGTYGNSAVLLNFSAFVLKLP